jgi:hypothetical protein
MFSFAHHWLDAMLLLLCCYSRRQSSKHHNIYFTIASFLPLCIVDDGPTPHSRLDSTHSI